MSGPGGEGERPLHVVILGTYMRFPHGMAATNRARLLARALVEAGAHVRVLSLQAAERPPHVENTAVRGVYQGIEFEYACGTTVRHGSFAIRRLIELRGWLAGAVRLVRLRRQGRLDVVYLWFTSQELHTARAVYLGLLRLLRVPVAIELNERPWPLRDDAGRAAQAASPLAGVAGAVAISRLLGRWAAGEAARLHRKVEIVEVPIVVDVREQTPQPYPAGEPLVVFAGSPAYDETIRFLFEAMRHVWAARPECRLVVTGANPEDPASRWLSTAAAALGGGHKLELAGYLSRPEVLSLYARAHVLLIPLFDDVRSRARFPTKIGEYLAAARPIVTSAVGEIPRYFSDGVDAVVCAPGDTAAYADGILRLLSDRELAASIGAAGRLVAEQRFDYALYAEPLYDGFATLARRHA